MPMTRLYCDEIFKVSWDSQQVDTICLCLLNILVVYPQDAVSPENVCCG